MKKYFKIIKNLHYIFAGAAYAFLIKSISGVIDIKIGLLSRKGRESLLITSLEPYLRELDSQNIRNRITIVVDEYGLNMNKTLVSMYGKRVAYINATRPFLCRSLYFSCLILGSKSPQVVRLYPRFGNEDRILWEDAAPSISFSSQELDRGKTLEKELSIEDKAFFCFGIRDESYYRAVLEYSDSSKVYNREADKETYIRNPSWSTYLRVAERLSNDNKIGIRMGKNTTSLSLNSISSGNIIDFSEIRDDFGDAYLMSKCKFLISGASGIFLFPSIFNIPILISDSYNFWCRGGGVSRGDLFLPSLLYSKKEKRLLNFSELIRIGPRYTDTYLHQNGLELIKNTEDEIFDAAQELENRIDGVYVSNEKSDYLNDKLNLLYNTHAEMTYGARMGASFIIKHEELVK